jgi:hypothetical protein
MFWGCCLCGSIFCRRVLCGLIMQRRVRCGLIIMRRRCHCCLIMWRRVLGGEPIQAMHPTHNTTKWKQ